MKAIEYLHNYGLFKDFEELGFNIGALRRDVGILPESNGALHGLCTAETSILRHTILNQLPTYEERPIIVTVRARSAKVQVRRTPNRSES